MPPIFSRARLFRAQKITMSPFMFAGAFVLTLSLGPGPALAAPGHAHADGGTPYGVVGKLSKVSRTIKINTLDMMYSIKSLHVIKGETIRFIVTNKSPIAHDFTIGDKATQVAHRREMVRMMGGGMAAMMAHDDANAVFLKPGESKQLVWNFTKVGDFEFACNIHGHYEANMKGPILVEPVQPSKGSGKPKGGAGHHSHGVVH